DKSPSPAGELFRRLGEGGARLAELQLAPGDERAGDVRGVGVPARDVALLEGESLRTGAAFGLVREAHRERGAHDRRGRDRDGRGNRSGSEPAVAAGKEEELGECER